MSVNDQDWKDWDRRLAQTRAINDRLRSDLASEKSHYVYYRMAGGAIATLTILLLLHLTVG